MSFNADLGLESAADGSVRLEAGPRHQVAPGTVHFAVLATLAEVAAAAAVGAAVVPATVQLNLMRRAAPGELVGRGTVLKRGRTLAVAEGEVTQEGRLVAKATVTFAVLEG
ncbi:MAG: PaaI family thioesterase [Thermoanaerobaculia bacterium]|nr:PaaI family thioesterase [Thermoanaerobaculia bacterium]